MPAGASGPHDADAPAEARASLGSGALEGRFEPRDADALPTGFEPHIPAAPSGASGHAFCTGSFVMS